MKHFAIASLCTLAFVACSPTNVAPNSGSGALVSSTASFALTKGTGFPRTPLAEGIAMIEHDEFSWIDVKAETVPFPYDQTGFSELLQSCGKDDSRAPELAESFAGLFGVSYTFTYKGEAQDGGEWTVSLFENVRGYVSLADLQKDFEACYAGGDYYPFAVTERFTAFASACGSGFDDGSGRSHGCDEVRTAVEPTITVF